MGDIKSAINDMETAYRLSPEILTYGKLIYIYTLDGNYQRVKELIENIPEEFQNHIEIEYNIGLFYIYNKDFERAYKYLETILPYSTDHDFTAMILSQLALASHEMGRYKDAIIYVNEALKLNPDLSMALNNRGMSWMGLGNPEKAIKDFNKAIKYIYQIPANLHFMIYNNRALAYTLTGRSKKAIKEINKLLETYDDSLLLCYNTLGFAKLAEGEYEEALHCFEKCFALNAPQVYYNYSDCLFSLDRENEALPYIIKGHSLTLEQWFPEIEKKESYRLSKYKPITKYALDAIEKDLFWFSAPHTLNDTAEAIYFREYLSYYTSMLDSLNGFFIASFEHKEDPEKEGCSNNMWGIYAKESQGMCIVYEYDPTRRSLPNIIFDKVAYSKEFAPYNHISMQAFIRNSFYVKKDDWEKEHEARLTYFAPELIAEKKPGCLLPLKNLGLKVAKIIFGERCSKTNINKVRKACKNLPYPIQFAKVEYDTQNGLINLIAKDLLL